MVVLHSIEELTRVPGPVHLAIGVFDGVHIDHQAVIRTSMAQPDGTAVVVTFDPHPARVLRPDRAPLMLTSTRHKLAILERLGVRQVLVLVFDARLAATEAEEFVRELESACCPLGSIAVGEDWTFGYRARGSVALLRSLGLTVHAVAPVEVEGVAARSTGVRTALEVGDFACAARLLGRPPTVLGRVVAGRQLGRKIGFRTANLELENEQLPPNGVYAVRATLDQRPLAGVANLGLRPSVESGDLERRLEVHLFDFSEEIYGRDLEVEWTAFLRPEQTFPSLDALTAQIARDAARARSLLEVA
ncbi:MAG: riboflavin biosynthesis protein RibF [Verrucomicrobiales bacterium]